MKLLDIILEYTDKKPDSKLNYKGEWLTAAEILNNDNFYDEIESDDGEYIGIFGDGIFRDIPNKCLPSRPLIEESEAVQECGCGNGCFRCLDVSWSDFI